MMSIFLNPFCYKPKKKKNLAALCSALFVAFFFCGNLTKHENNYSMFLWHSTPFYFHHHHHHQLYGNGITSTTTTSTSTPFHLVMPFNNNTELKNQPPTKINFLLLFVRRKTEQIGKTRC